MILNGGKKPRVRYVTIATEPAANENHYSIKKEEEMKKPVEPILPQNVEDLLKDMLDTYPYPYSSNSRVYVRRRDAKMRSLGK